MKTIKVYFLRADETQPFQGYIGEIENSLRAKQNYVGGTIQVIRLTPEIDCILNDDGKLLGLPINRLWKENDEEEPLDVFVGNILCCRHNEEGEFTDIHEEDISVIEKMLIPLADVGVMNGNIIYVSKPAKFLAEWKE